MRWSPKPDFPIDPGSPRQRVVARWREPLDGRAERKARLLAGKPLRFSELALLECGHSIVVVSSSLAEPPLVRLARRLARSYLCESCLEETGCNQTPEERHLRLVWPHPQRPAH